MDKVFGIPSYNELEQEMQWEDNYKRIRILANISASKQVP
jgi:hypothetical protein